MSDESGDQEIMEAVREHEAQQLDHVKALHARAVYLISEADRLIAEDRRNIQEEKTRAVREHAINRYYDRHLRTALPSVDLTGVDERTGPNDMQAFAQWHNARQAT